MLLLEYGYASRGQGRLWLSLGWTLTQRRGTSGFLFLLQHNHEGGPPGLKTHVLGLVVACHPAQQQPLPEEEETQGAVRWREHQTKAWRVSQSGISCMTYAAEAAPDILIYCYYQPNCIVIRSSGRVGEKNGDHYICLTLPLKTDYFSSTLD